MLTPEDLMMLRELFTEVVRTELERFKAARGTGAERTKRWREKRSGVTVTSRKTSRPTGEKRHGDVTQVSRPTNGRASSTPVWLAYAEAYRQRYGVEPTRNAKVNGQLSQLVKRLGEDAAPVAAWFIGHGASRYVAAGHTVGLMLMDAEKLHTEWRTGRRVTATAAVQSDRTQANGDIWGKLIEEARG